MNPIVVLRPDDAREAAMVHAACMHDPWSPASIRQSLENPHVLALGVEQDGALVGFGLFMVVEGEAEVLTLAIDPQFQRRGLARHLMEAMIARVSERGVGRIFLEVAGDNNGASALYLKMKFSADGVRPRYYTAGRERPVDAILMSRTLSL